jgi:hypothetical protein
VHHLTTPLPAPLQSCFNLLHVGLLSRHFPALTVPVKVVDLQPGMDGGTVRIRNVCAALSTVKLDYFIQLQQGQMKSNNN